MIFRLATLGLLSSLLASIILAVISFSVPSPDSVFFLQASLSEQPVNGTITIGVLGYCLQSASTTACSLPAFGWQFTLIPNQHTLFDRVTTNAFVLHVAALGFAGLGTIVALFTHVRAESVITWCISICLAGLAALTTAVAFLADSYCFYSARADVEKAGGSATIGSAFWLTLSACVMLFVSVAFHYAERLKGRNFKFHRTGFGGFAGARVGTVEGQQKRREELGLPAFPELERIQPQTRLRTNEPQYLEEEEQSELQEQLVHPDVRVGGVSSAVVVNGGTATAWHPATGYVRKHLNSEPGFPSTSSAATRPPDAYSPTRVRSLAYPASLQAHMQEQGITQILTQTQYPPPSPNGSVTGPGIAGVGAFNRYRSPAAPVPGQFTHGQYASAPASQGISDGVAYNSVQRGAGTMTRPDHHRYPTYPTYPRDPEPMPASFSAFKEVFEAPSDGAGRQPEHHIAVELLPLSPSPTQNPARAETQTVTYSSSAHSNRAIEQSHAASAQSPTVPQDRIALHVLGGSSATAVRDSRDTHEDPPPKYERQGSQ